MKEQKTKSAVSFEEERRKRRQRGLERKLIPVRRIQGGKIVLGGRRLVDFSSNDYLGLSFHPDLIAAAAETLKQWGAGSGGSRLMTGDCELHHELEQKVAALKGGAACLLFGSGYLANCGIIPALCGRGDVIFSDRFNHASIVDGALLSRSMICRFRHNDLDHLEDILKKRRKKHRRALIVVESLHSMEGDIAPVSELIEFKQRYDAMLMIDEAHAVGVFGTYGEGLVSRSRSGNVDVMVGTFGKALGGYGAFAVLSEEMARHIMNTARSFIFSTALPPSVLGGNLAALELLEKEAVRRLQVLELASYFRISMEKNLKLETPGRSQIVPLMIGDNEKALEIAERLEVQGFYVKAIRPPTVPEATARIRISLCADHSREDVDSLVEALANAL